MSHCLSPCFCRSPEGPRSQLSSLFRGRSCDLWGQKQSPPPQALAALASRRTPVCVSKGGGNRHLRSSCLLAPVLFFTCSNVCTSSCGPYNIQTKSPRPWPRKRSGRREGFQDFHPGRLTLVPAILLFHVAGTPCEDHHHPWHPVCRGPTRKARLKPHFKQGERSGSKRGQVGRADEAGIACDIRRR